MPSRFVSVVLQVFPMPSRFVSAVLHAFLIPPTNSSADINLDTVSPPTVTPCFAAFNCYYQMSLTYTLNRLGDSVHPCATPCQISTKFDISPSKITALPAPSFILFLIFSLVPISHTFSHNTFLQTAVIGLLSVWKKYAVKQAPRLAYLE